MSEIVQPKKFIVANLEYRLNLYYPQCNIQIGRGNTNANIVVIQSHTKMSDRDAITRVLKNFGVLDDAYRATTTIVEFPKMGINTPEIYPDLIGQHCRKEKPSTAQEINRYFLKELIEIIDPKIIVAYGSKVVSFLRRKKIRSFQSYSGKKFSVEDLTNITFYGTIDSTEYGFASAPRALKARSKAEWTKIVECYKAKLKNTGHTLLKF